MRGLKVLQLSLVQRGQRDQETPSSPEISESVEYKNVIKHLLTSLISLYSVFPTNSFNNIRVILIAAIQLNIANPNASYHFIPTLHHL